MAPNPEKPLAAVILAAGRSTRMKSPQPKVLMELCGRPMLEWVTALTSEAQPSILVLNPDIQDKVSARFPDCQVAIQEQARGTGDALKSAQSLLSDFHGDVLVLCGDMPLLQAASIESLVAQHRQQEAAASVLSFVPAQNQGYGRIERDNQGQVMSIVEEADCSPQQKNIQECNTGTYLFQAQHLWSCLESLNTNNQQGEYYLTDVIADLVKAGQKVAAWTVADSSEGQGVNSGQDLAAATRVMQDRLIADHLASGVRIIDPSRTVIEYGVEIAPGAVIEPFSVLRRGVSVASDCTVGPFAHLRVGTELSAGAEIGDFVETKNAKLGEGSKAKHLSYLGDVTLGKDCNVGAGTVFCNYDGKQKHQIDVGDQVFIGSGSLLVAPLKMGNQSATGAGAVVTRGHDVPAGETVVGVPARPLSTKPHKDSVK